MRMERRSSAAADLALRDATQCSASGRERIAGTALVAWAMPAGPQNIRCWFIFAPMVLENRRPYH